ncbi:MAG: GNAT family N-acetyltransferase, partial [Proteobacteria bacterium]|nr:GNAT family N-acetyltransferase [Pseudomonadota bacterium]
LSQHLRDQPSLWAYKDEYPLVLSNTKASLSHCLYENDTLVAHASMFVRELKHCSSGKSFFVALIGNVATAPEHRGQGFQRQLMTYLEKTAELQGAKALILWSDLHAFYQRLGFSSNGRERRFVIRSLERPEASGIAKVQAQTLSDTQLSRLLALRPKLEWSLERSIEDFRMLLGIPECHLFIRRKAAQIASWFVIGKGADMAGVIHEWGSENAATLIQDIRSVLKDYNIPELTLLAPMILPGIWSKTLEVSSSEISEHPMALVKSIGQTAEATNALSRGFIWGLDSI